MTADVVRIVLDSNQIVGAGSRWLDESVANANDHRRLLVCVAREHSGLYCDEIIDEYLEKLLERRHPPERARKLITYIIGSFTRVALVSEFAPVPPVDPDDEVFLICALDGDADWLVSEDTDLLDLKANYPRPKIGNCQEIMHALGV
ncbi:MAG: PIN domain-containing protein [Thiotrichales bacterium]|nr:PIN domain-containing protein [Thiotrichales bacterium]